jgi:hypothetical protein
MRAREFITEADDLTAQSVSTLPGAKVWPALDNSSPYHSYRYGVALAAAPHSDMDKEGPVKQNMMTVSYTDADEKIIQAAGKTMGVSGKNLSTKDSRETADNVTSPVAKRKKNRYGV